MNDGLIEEMAAAGLIFLAWHFLTAISCVAGLLLERALRKSNPHVRSALLRLTLLLALVIPAGCATWNEWPASASIFAASAPENAAPVSGPANASALVVINWDQVAVWRPAIADVAQMQDRFVTGTPDGVHWLRIFYGTFLGASSLVSLYLLCRLARAFARSAALRRAGKRLDASEEAKCQAMATAMKVVPPDVLGVDGLEGPLLLGFFRPAILLPTGTRGRGEIYAHELTHLRRRDLWWHLFARLATILMPLQPGFWLLKKALERADEDVCDDMVLARGASRSAYAELLLKVAEAQEAPSPDLCLPMAAFRSQLERRLRRLMDTARPLAARVSLSSLLAGLAPLLVIGLVTGAIYLDSERALEAENKGTSEAGTGHPKTDYASFLKYGSPAEKEALAGAFKAADAWLAPLDEHRYAKSAAPDFLGEDSLPQKISPEDWQRFLAGKYERLGEVQSRELNATTPETTTLSDFSLNYHAIFKKGDQKSLWGEKVDLLRGADGQWRVVKLVIYTPTPAPNQGPVPVDDASAPIIRSIEAEIIYMPSIPLNEMKGKLIAASGLQVGAPCHVASLRRAVRQLFATGLADNVAVNAIPVTDGVEVAIVAQVNPVAQQISFEGVSATEEAKLRPLLREKEGRLRSDYLTFEDTGIINAELAGEGLHVIAAGASRLSVGDNRSPATSSVTFKIAPQ